MTDRTDALVALADKIEFSGTIETYEKGEIANALRALAEQPAGAVGVQAWMANDGTGRVIDAKAKAAADRSGGATASAMAAYTIPLAPPAASVDVEGLRGLANEIDRSSENIPDHNPMKRMLRHWASRLRPLPDSAGGAKGEYTVLRPDGTHYTTDIGGADMARKREGYRVLAESTPQPDRGDGAVIDAELDDLVLQYGNARAHGLMDEAAEIYTKISCRTRPSAAAAVPEGFVQRVRNDLAAWIDTYGEGHIDAENLLAECDAMLAAAPAAHAAPKGGVDDLCSEARDLQRKNYGDAMGLHLDMIDWARKYDALTTALATPRAEQESN